MRKTVILTTTLIAVLVLMIATGALAAKPVCEEGAPDPHPSCRNDTTTTTAPDVNDDIVWTCTARIDNGASAWVMGEWIASNGLPMEIDPSGDAPVYYRTDNLAGAIPACIDIHPDHLTDSNWLVAWSANEDSVISQKRNGGLKMVFEREVHNDPYAEHIARTHVGNWEAVFDLSGYHEVDPDYTVDSLVFVAMPAHRDTWLFTDGYLTITPNGQTNTNARSYRL